MKRSQDLLVFLLSFLVLTGCSTQQPLPAAASPRFEYSATNEVSDLDARIAFLEARVKKRPKGFLEQAELAGYYLQKGKLRQNTTLIGKAEALARTSYNNFPNEPALMVQADLLQMEHKFDESLAIIAKVLKSKHDPVGPRLMGVRALLAQGKPEEARAMLQPIADQPFFVILFTRAQVAEALGEEEQAIELYATALRREREVSSPSESARLRAVWARLEIARGNLDQAQELLQAADAIPVDVPLVDMQRARLAVLRKDWARAATICRQGFALYQDPLFLLELAKVLQAQGQVAESKENYQTAIDLLRARPYGHERDMALALMRVDPAKNKAEVLALMDRELRRRRDPATLEVWAEVEKQYGPLPEPTPAAPHTPKPQS